MTLRMLFVGVIIKLAVRLDETSSDSRDNSKLHTRAFGSAVKNCTIVPTQSYVTTIYEVFPAKKDVAEDSKISKSIKSVVFPI